MALFKTINMPHCEMHDPHHIKLKNNPVLLIIKIIQQKINM